MKTTGRARLGLTVATILVGWAGAGVGAGQEAGPPVPMGSAQPVAPSHPMPPVGMPAPQGFGGMGMGEYGAMPFGMSEPPMPPHVLGSAVLRVRCNPGQMQLDARVLTALVNSSYVVPDKPKLVALEITALALGGGTGASLLGPVEGMGELFGHAPAGGPSEGLFELRVLAPAGVEMDATPCLAGAAAGLGKVLNQENEKMQGRWAKELETANREVARAESRMTELRMVQRKMMDQAGVPDLNSDMVRKRIAELRGRQQDLEHKRDHSHRRQISLNQRLAEITKQVEDKMRSDPALAELEGLVRIQEQQLEEQRNLAGLREKMLKAQGGSAEESQERLKAQEQSLAAAQAVEETRQKIARQRWSIQSSVEGGKDLEAMNQELAKWTMQFADDEGQLASVGEELARMRDNNVLELADRYEIEVVGKLDMANAALQGARQRALALRTALAMLSEPEVSMLGN